MIYKNKFLTNLEALEYGRKMEESGLRYLEDELKNDVDKDY